MAIALARKVHIAAAAAGGVGLLVIAGAAFVASEHLVHQDLRARADLAMDSFDANLHFTETQVAPLLQRQLGAQFLPQAVPFYSAVKSSGLETERDGETLRVPTTNPTNEDDRPTEWEGGIIKAFADKPDLHELESEHQTQAGTSFVLSRPITAEPACLSCHGRPSDAPRSLLETYGSAGGFGWTRGTVVGATVISIPEAAARRRTLATISGFAAVVALFLIGIVGLLDYLVQVTIVRPLGHLAQYASDVSLGMVDCFHPGAARVDAVGSLAKAFDRMRNSLAIAMRLLEQGAPGSSAPSP